MRQVGAEDFEVAAAQIVGQPFMTNGRTTTL
jgi:hypothetical protein